MANFLASVFGGGSQTAPKLQQYDPTEYQNMFLGQNFGQSQGISNGITANTSAANLDAYTTGLNKVDPSALAGINATNELGNNLLTGSLDSLPSWAQNYLNTGARKGAESAIGRGVGAFSANGLSGVNQYKGNNAIGLVQFGANLSNQASGQASNIVNSTLYKNDPWSTMMTPGQFQQTGMYNNQIENQQATYDTAVQNYNANNSPIGSAIRTGLQDLVYLAGSYLSKGGNSPAPKQNNDSQPTAVS